MFLYTKLALVTCAFYLGIAILIDGAIFGMALWKGGVGVFASKTGWIVFFGAVWLISFLISWRIVITPLLARIQRP
jgi:hypothetical protein